MELDVRKSSHGGQGEVLKFVVATDILAHRADALPVVYHVLVQIGFDYLRIPVHVPYLISALDDESWAVKLLRSIPVETGLFPQARVVVASARLLAKKLYNPPLGARKCDQS